jgi:hypothetical protein
MKRLEPRHYKYNSVSFCFENLHSTSINITGCAFSTLLTDFLIAPLLEMLRSGCNFQPAGPIFHTSFLWEAGLLVHWNTGMQDQNKSKLRLHILHSWPQEICA